MLVCFHDFAALVVVPPLYRENLASERVQPRATAHAREQFKLVVGGTLTDGALEKVQLLGGEINDCKVAHGVLS